MRVDIDSLADYYPLPLYHLGDIPVVGASSLYLSLILQVSGTILDAVTSVLQRLDKEWIRSLLERLLLVVDIEDVEDLVKEDDIKDILTPCQPCKFLDAFRRKGLCMDCIKLCSFN